MEKFNTYLESIGMGPDLIAIVQKHYDFYTTYLGISIDDIFVSEYINAEGNRIYEDLLFYNDSFFMEVQGFRNKNADDYDQDTIKITSWILKRTNYNDLQNPSDASRCSLKFNLYNDRYGQLKASKHNCVKLIEFLKNVVIKNMA